MNNTVEKWLFWISQGKVATVGPIGLQVTWAGVQAIDVKFYQDLTHQKSLKWLLFDRVTQKIKKVDVFWGDL